MDRVLLRLAVLGVLIVVAFVALFSRLWFLQVLASDDYTDLAQENRIRFVYSEPSRGRILDRNGKVIVQNRLSLAVTVDRQIVDEPSERNKTLRQLSKLLEMSTKDLRDALNDITVSPYKPVAVAYDVNMNAANTIRENGEDYPGVYVERLPVREYPQGKIAAQFLGYVGEISPEDLESSYFKGAKPAYRAGDIVGRSGLERYYDRSLRGTPSIDKVIVNSASNVIRSDRVQVGVPGNDLMLSIDARIQRIAEDALESGIQAARASYLAPWGAAVVMDPNTGQVIASASNPTFDPAILADGFSNKDQKLLEGGTPDDTIDDAMLNRVTSEGGPPGSSFKVVTAGAAIFNDIIDPYDSLDCNPTFTYGVDNQIFANWTSVDMGLMSLARSLEVSCDTYYYQLGAMMEDRWGAGNGDGTERFQDYMRKVGFDAPTGIDLPGESGGNVADKEWLDQYCDEVGGIGCEYGWLPGYTVNMSIGQGDLVVTPMQMANVYAAIVNGGKLYEPRIGMSVLRDGEEVKSIESEVSGNLGLDATTLEVMRTGLEDVVSGDEGTGGSAFAGFPLDRVQVAGKTGTAEIGETGRNFAWFVSYAPADNPEYVIAVCLYQAGHGGESAAPVARQIFEGIYNLDKETTVTLGQDESD
ncbi:MAG: penicillin-binding protein 2 [Actinobacteria bacterium]|nr:penicillin-binding protein 2 [Actinomycetota bacterium]